MRALDGDICAVVVYLDVGEVDKVGEVVALLQGRRTFDMVPYIRGSFAYCLEDRKAYHIQRPRRHSVVIEHRCGFVIKKVPSQKLREWSNDPPF